MNHICKVHLQASIQILLMPLATVFTKFAARWQCAISAAHTESEFQCHYILQRGIDGEQFSAVHSSSKSGLQFSLKLYK